MLVMLSPETIKSWKKISEITFISTLDIRQQRTVNIKRLEMDEVSPIIVPAYWMNRVSKLSCDRRKIQTELRRLYEARRQN